MSYAAAARRRERGCRVRPPRRRGQQRRQGDRVSLEDTTVDLFCRQVETNSLGTVHVTKAAVPILREQGGGRIIQVSSLGGRLGSPGMTACQSAKWAVGGFSEALAAEVAGASMTIPPYQDTVH